MKKLLIIFLLLSFFSRLSVAQTKLVDFLNLELGSSYWDEQSKGQIFAMFTQPDKEYEIYKGDFLNTYKIIFHHAPFDYYGNADITFQFVKDSLSNISIEYNFPEQKISEFARFLRQFVTDMNSNPVNHLDKSLSDLNIENLISIASKECKASNNYDQFNGRVVGRDVWSINSHFGNSSIFIKVELCKGQREFNQFELQSTKSISYSGSWMQVTINLLSAKTIGLYVLNEKQFSHNYECIQKYYDNKLITWDSDGKPIINESTNNINLKEDNGIYKLPIIINNVITLEVILDPGASDISLSYDVFLVLYKAGTIDEKDFIGSQTYQLADGSSIKSSIINLKSIFIGGKEIKNVRASISKSVNSPLLLGQDALKKLRAYRIDVTKKLLIIE